MITIEITNAEREAGALTPEHLETAKHAVLEEGFIGLVGAVSEESCDLVYNKMVEEYEEIQREYGPFAVRGAGSFEGARYKGQAPPPRNPYVCRDIVVNDFAAEVTTAVMGDGVHCGNYGANWSFPVPEGEEPARQGVHGDAGDLFPGMPVASPPFILNLSIPLIDFTEENGATEIWAGTQKMAPQLSDISDSKERKAYMEKRRAEVPPERMVCPKGTIIIRDPRAWHAGMPNLTDKPRIMIAMRHHIFWMRNGAGYFRQGLFRERELTVEEGCEHLFEHDKLRFFVRTKPAPYNDYKLHAVVNAKPELKDELMGDSVYVG